MEQTEQNPGIYPLNVLFANPFCPRCLQKRLPCRESATEVSVRRGIQRNPGSQGSAAPEEQPR